MASQLDHLAARPRVGVIPRTRPAHVFTTTGFSLRKAIFNAVDSRLTTLIQAEFYESSLWVKLRIRLKRAYDWMRQARVSIIWWMCDHKDQTPSITSTANWAASCQLSGARPGLRRCLSSGNTMHGPSSLAS